MPDVPSFGELGVPGFDGLFVSLSALAPAGTPKPIIAALNREIVACQDKPDIKDRLEKGSYEAARLSPEQTLAFFDDDHKNWSQVVQGNRRARELMRIMTRMRDEAFHDGIAASACNDASG